LPSPGSLQIVLPLLHGALVTSQKPLDWLGIELAAAAPHFA
jgi:hypothetical protein